MTIGSKEGIYNIAQAFVNDGVLCGYCGHDMLNEFDLINMKGRLYDPVVGRFLSPDNYVQLPNNGQSYNRYSYCLNNPLKYIDPDGEYFGFDDILAMAIGGCVNLGVNIAEGNIKNIWHGLSSFAVGAAAGECALYGNMFTSSSASLGAESGPIFALWDKSHRLLPFPIEPAWGFRIHSIFFHRISPCYCCAFCVQAQAYFAGQKSADEVAKLVQSKANIYVNEQR